MKKVKVSLMALALTLGVGGAFATNAHYSKKQTNYNWQVTNSSGTPIHNGAFVANVDQATAEDDLGCSGSTTDCAVTVQSQNGPVTSPAIYIYKN